MANVTLNTPSLLTSAVTTRAATSSGVPNCVMEDIRTGSTVIPNVYPLIDGSGAKFISSKCVFNGLFPGMNVGGGVMV